MNGHIDVVPVGDLSTWKRNKDPFSGDLDEQGEKLYGRGVTDMKGGHFAALFAIQTLQALGIILKGNVIYQSVVEEESGGAGTLSTILKGYKADVALVTEPTGLKIFPKQQVLKKILIQCFLENIYST